MVVERETPQGFCGYSAYLAVPLKQFRLYNNTYLLSMLCYLFSDRRW